MQRLVLMLLFLLGGGSSLRAQAPVAVQWQRRLGSRASDEQTTATIYTRHHRIASVGSRAASNTDHASALWLLSARGDSLRTIYYSYPFVTPLLSGMEEYSLYAVAEASNGDLLMSGSRGRVTSPTTGVYDHVLIRTDSLGTVKWLRTYPTADVLNTFALLPLPDNGALVVVTTQHPLGSINFPVSLPTVIRVDSLGTVRWQRTYGQPYYTLRCITALSDGSYALAGNTLSGPPQWRGGAWVQRINLSGDTLRSRVLLASVTFYGVSEAPGGGLALVGDDYTDALMAMTDSLDRLQWRHNVASQLPPHGATFPFVRALRQPGQVLVGGYVPVPRTTPPTAVSYLGVWQAPAAPGGPAVPVWAQLRAMGLIDRNQLVPAGPGRLIVGTVDTESRSFDLLFTSLANVPAFYEPPLCRTPPYAVPLLTPVAGTNQFSFSDISLAGPQYAQLLLWRWDFGDGSPPYFGRTPPPHAFAALTPATAVRLTVTNNLGCTHTTAVYPFALPARAGQGRPAATLHPNPAGAGAAAVTLTVPGLRAQPPVAGVLLNSVGQVVWRGGWPVAALAQGAALPGAAALPPGVYALRLWPQEGPVTLRLVRE